MQIHYREAKEADIPQMQVIRNSVKENALSDPALVPYNDYVLYLNERGKGWVACLGEEILGFSIVDMKDQNVWALFVAPGHEKKGIGRGLHDILVKWYFTQTSTPLWLGTAPGTRAEKFYRKAGWVETGKHGKGEIKFEMHTP